MCLDVIGCHAIDTVIYDDSRRHSPYRACPPIISSSHHLSFLAPPPLSPALSCLLALNNPPPPGVGGADERAVCGCGRDGGLLASVLCSCRSLACARSLSSCLMFGFSSRASFFFLLIGSGLGGRRRAPFSLRSPCSPSRAFPASSLLSVPRLICRVRFDCRPLRLVLSALLVSCPRFVVPRFVPPRRSSPRSSVCLLRLSRSRGGLALVAILFRSALRPALLVVGRGGLLCRGSLSSRAARCLKFRSSWSLVLRWLVVSPRVRPCLPCLPPPSRLVRAVGVGISCLRVACPRYDYRPAPHIEERGDNPVSVRLFFLVRSYSSMMA